MKNIATSNLKNCMILTTDKFTNIICELFDNTYVVEYSYDGINYLSYDDNEMDTDILHKKLEDYFGVTKITSIHTDDCDLCGVWICYIDEQTSTETTSEITAKCNDYNALAQKHNLNSQLKYQYNATTNEATLMLGSIEQLQYGTHQCILADNAQVSLKIVQAMIKTLCFNHGE